MAENMFFCHVLMKGAASQEEYLNKRAEEEPEYETEFLEDAWILNSYADRLSG